MDPGTLKRTVLFRSLFFLGILVLLIFPAAGTFDYWQAWVWIAVVFVPALFVSIWLLTTDPELMERRMRMKEKESAQRTIIKFSWAAFIIIFLIIGFDRRYGWSSVPAWLVLLADGVVFAGYVLFIRVLRANRFVSRTIEVEPGQTVVTTGPYAVIRHPLYASGLIMYAASPLALGSAWGVAATLLYILPLVARIRNEERLLMRDLPGYREYAAQTPYRLIPHIW